MNTFKVDFTDLGKVDGHTYLVLTNADVRGLADEIVPVHLGGTGLKKGGSSHGATSFKSHAEPKILEVELDLIENLDRFQTFMKWFDATAGGPPCPEAKAHAETTLVLTGDTRATVTLEGLLPVGWTTSAFDSGLSPRVTLKLAFDALTGIKLGKTSVPRSLERKPPAPNPGSAPGSAWTHVLSWSKEGKDITAQPESCSGFSESIEVERIWSVDQKKLIHTVCPGRIASPIRFAVKMDSDSSGVAAVPELFEWFQSITGTNGRSTARNFVYTFSLNGGGLHQFKLNLDETHVSAVEIRGVAPEKTLTFCFDLVAGQISTPHKTPDSHHEHPSLAMAPSLLAYRIYPNFTHRGCDNKIPALLLCPRYLVPSVSRRMDRTDVKLSLSSGFHSLKTPGELVAGNVNLHQAALVHVEDASTHYSPNDDKNPQLIHRVAFYVYASNPWAGHQMVADDLCASLENVFFPLFYASVGPDIQYAPADQLTSFLNRFGVAASSAGLGWRDTRAGDTQLPKMLFNADANGAPGSNANNSWALSLPVVISFFKPEESRAGDSFTNDSITGFLVRSSYEIDQWDPADRPWRARVTLDLQEARGLSVTAQDLNKKSFTCEPSIQQSPRAQAGRTR